MSDPDTERRDAIGDAATTLAGQSATETIELNSMSPTLEQLRKFLALPDRPVVMVNLLKFKDGGGAEEYAKYGAAMQKILADIGAEMIFSGQCQTTLIGGAEWDVVALVRYPNARALVEMAQSPVYQEAHVHRAEGLEGQVNIAVFER